MWKGHICHMFVTPNYLCFRSRRGDKDGPPVSEERPREEREGEKEVMGDVRWRWGSNRSWKCEKCVV